MTDELAARRVLHAQRAQITVEMVQDYVEDCTVRSRYWESVGHYSRAAQLRRRGKPPGWRPRRNRPRDFSSLPPRMRLLFQNMWVEYLRRKEAGLIPEWYEREWVPVDENGVPDRRGRLLLRLEVALPSVISERPPVRAT